MSTFKDFSKQLSWGPVAATLVATLALVGGNFLGAALVITGLWVGGDSLSVALDTVTNETHWMFLSYLLVQVFALGLIYAFMRYRRADLSELGFRKFNYKQAAGLIFLSYIGFLFLAAVTVLVLQNTAPNIDFTARQEIGFLDAREWWEMLLAFIAMVIVAPLAEEVIFRGLLLPAFSKSLGIVVAVILTSIMFGLLHPPLSVMISIGIFSLFLCWIYIRTGSIWPAILLHSSKNLIAFIGIFGVGL